MDIDQNVKLNWHHFLYTPFLQYITICDAKINTYIHGGFTYHKYSMWLCYEWERSEDITKDKHPQHTVTGFYSSQCYHGNKKIHQEI